MDEESIIRNILENVPRVSDVELLQRNGETIRDRMIPDDPVAKDIIAEARANIAKYRKSNL